MIVMQVFQGVKGCWIIRNLTKFRRICLKHILLNSLCSRWFLYISSGKGQIREEGCDSVVLSYLPFWTSTYGIGLFGSSTGGHWFCWDFVVLVLLFWGHKFGIPFFRIKTF